MSDTTVLAEQQSEQRTSRALLIGAIVFGGLGSDLFFDHLPGLSIPLFVLAFYSLVGIAFHSQFERRMTVPNYMLVLITLSASVYFHSADPIFWMINLLLLPVLIVCHTMALTGQLARTFFERLLDLIFGFVYRPLVFCLLPFRLIRQQFHWKADHNAVKIGIGIVVTLPLLLLIIPLLMSADPVFNHLLGNVSAFVQRLSFDTLIGRFLLAAVLALGAFSYLWSLRVPVHVFWHLPVTTSRRIWQLDRVIAATILAVFNLLYLLFDGIQFSYLFGVLPNGYTYSSYARHGFFELVAITLINLSLLLFCFHFLNQQSDFLRGLETLLVGCTLVMLVSAFMRMRIYEQMYGYTFLRVATHAFMLFLALLLLVTLVAIFRPKLPLVRFFGLALAAFIIILSNSHIDYWIAKSNIDRYQQTGKLDTVYLTNLSNDAAPQLIRLLDVDDHGIRKAAYSELKRRQEELKQPTDWQSFNLMNWQTKRRLAELIRNE